MTTINMKDLYLEEYGEIASFLKLEDRAVMKPLTENLFVSMVSRRAPEVLIVGAYNCLLNGTFIEGRPEEYPYCKWVPRAVIRSFFNLLTPTKVAEQIDEIIGAWMATAVQSDNPRSGYNIALDVFARLYCAMGESLSKVGKLRENNGWSSYFAKMLLNSKRDGVSKAIRLLKWKEKIPQRIILSDIKRLLRAPYEVRVVALKGPCLEALHRDDNHSCSPYRIDWEAVAAILKDKDRLAEYLPNKFLWATTFGRIPKDEILIRAIGKEVSSFDFGTYKSAEKLIRYEQLSTTGQEERELTVSVSLIAQKYFTTGNLSQFVEYKRRNMGMSMHDIFAAMPSVPFGKEVGEFMLKAKDSSMEKVFLVIRMWQYLSPEARKGKLSEMFAAAEKEANNPDNFTLQATIWGTSEEKAIEIHKKWTSGLSNLQKETIPAVEAKAGAYVMRKLPREDGRGLFLGQLTNCCQHVLGGAAESSAWHGAIDEDGGFYVIEKNNKIVAQSWIWRNEETVCFDNIELLGDLKDTPCLIDLYQEVANKIVGILGIRRVTLGLGYTDVVVPWRATNSVSSPKGCYSDARDQVLVAEC
jgi:hypothetical protein